MDEGTRFTLRTGWPMSRLQHLCGLLFGSVVHCEMCNSDGHNSWECWIIDHTRYVGLFDGLLHADPELEAFYRQNYFHGQANADHRWRHLLREAHQMVGKRNGYAGSKYDATGQPLDGDAT